MSDFLSGLETGASNVLDKAIDNPLATGAIIAGSAAIVTGGVLAAKAYKKRKKSSSRKSKSSRKRVSRSKRKRSKYRGRKTPHTAGKRRDTSRRRIRYTKNGQPYVLGANGKAKFIKKSSAKRSRKLKGGKY